MQGLGGMDGRADVKKIPRRGHVGSLSNHGSPSRFGRCVICLDGCWGEASSKRFGQPLGALSRGRGGFPGISGEAPPGDIAVEPDVGNEGIETAVVLFGADEAEDEEAHVGVVEVGGKGVQDMDLGAPDRVLVEGIVADGHDHGEEGKFGGGEVGGPVGMVGGQGEGGVAKVDARGGVGDPGSEGGVDGEVCGGDAKLRGFFLVCLCCAEGREKEESTHTSLDPRPKPAMTLPSICSG